MAMDYSKNFQLESYSQVNALLQENDSLLLVIFLQFFVPFRFYFQLLRADISNHSYMNMNDNCIRSLDCHFGRIHRRCSG